MDISLIYGRMTTLHAARGGHMYSEAGPVALQGRSGWYMWPGVHWIVDWVYPGYGTRYCQGPTHAFNLVPGPILTLNVPSFLIDTVSDEVSNCCIPHFTEFRTCFTEFSTLGTLHPG